MAGIADLVAGAMSVANREYVSVRSQADSEQAALGMERAEIKADDKAEHQELAAIYVRRGLDAALAKQVAKQLMSHDALGAHACDELGISETLRARPPANLMLMEEIISRRPDIRLLTAMVMAVSKRA